MALHVASTTVPQAEIDQFLQERGFEVASGDQPETENGNTPPAAEAAPSDPPPTAAKPAEAAPKVDGEQPAGASEPPDNSSHGTKDTQEKPSYRGDKRSPKERIQQLAREKNAERDKAQELQRKADELAAENLELKARLNGEKKPEAPAAEPAKSAEPALEKPRRPKLSDPDIDFDQEKLDEALEKHDEALIDYSQKLADQKRQKEIQDQATADAQRDFETQQAAWIETGRKAYPDWDAVRESALVEQKDINYHPDVIQTILDHPLSQHIVYHLASNSEDARFIAGLSPAKAGVELASLAQYIEADLAANPDAAAPAAPAAQAHPPEVPKTRVAPPNRVAPITPVNAGGSPGSGGPDALQRLAESGNSVGYREARLRQKAGRH